MTRSSLPALPNLLQQKTRAKELLKAWKSGDPDAMARLCESHHRFGDADPGQIRPDDLQLADAQHVIARECGFASWPRFKVHINQLRSRQRNDEVLEFIRAVTIGDQEDALGQLAGNAQLARLEVAEDNEPCISLCASVIREWSGCW